MSSYDNIFRLGARAASEKVGPEDLFTAQLAWLLRLDQEVCRHWAALLSQGSVPGSEEVGVSLWPYGGPDVPDMVLELRGGERLICEHKLDSGFGPGQLLRYLELAQREATRTGRAHRVTAVTKDPVRIASACADHDQYVRPGDRRHFRWEQLYALIRSLPRPAEPHLVGVRAQFLDYMRELSLDPCPLVPGLELLFAGRDVQGRVGQRKGFARLWTPTRSFFEARGFWMQRGSIMELYAHATEHAELAKASGMSHFYMSPSSVRPKNLRDDLPLPLVEVRVVVLPQQQPVLDRLEGLPYPLMFGDIAVSCGKLPVQRKYRHHVFVFSLASAVGERDIRPDAAQRLAMVVTGLYQYVAEAFSTSTDAELSQMAREPALDRTDGQAPALGAHETNPGSGLPPVPPDTDDIGEIFRHAYEYNGYERHGGFDAVARIAGRCRERRRRTGRWEGTLEELRCTLFFQQRAAHHQGEAPTGEWLDLVRELYQAIRSRWGEARQ